MIFLLSNVYSYRVEYFDQVVSHYNFRLQDSFKQKYLIDDSVFDKKSGLIMLYCGNEGPIQMFYNNTGFYNEYVKQEMKGYFGQSWPFGNKNKSYSKENLVYLSTDQALMDLVTFTKFIKNKYCQNCPVLAFGGSYGGMLAVWLRMKYPHIVNMAHGASAPIYYFRNREGLSWQSFNKVVTSNFQRSSRFCTDVVRQAYFRLNSYIKKGQAPFQTLNRVMNLCRPMNKIQHLYNLLDFLYNGYSYMAMLNYPYQTDFLLKLPAWPANSSCKAYTGLSLNSSDQVFFSAIKKGLDFYYNYQGTRSCNQIFQDTSSDYDMSGWDILACGDQAMPFDADGISDMFYPNKFNFTAYTTNCQSKYNLTPNYNYILDHFGGATDQQLKAYSKIFFTNGDLDPWSPGSPNYSLSSQLPVCIVKDGAHHLDLRTQNPKDPASAIECRKQILQKLKQWSASVRAQLHSLQY